MNDHTIVVAYIRVSTKQQTLGIEVQCNAITKWAYEHNKLIVSWHIDHGINSIKSIHCRPALSEALHVLKTIGAGALVVQTRDRLARSVTLMKKIEAEINTRGAVLISIGHSELEKSLERDIKRLMSQ